MLPDLLRFRFSTSAACASTQFAWEALAVLWARNQFFETPTRLGAVSSFGHIGTGVQPDVSRSLHEVEFDTSRQLPGEVNVADANSRRADWRKLQ